MVNVILSEKVWSLSILDFLMQKLPNISWQLIFSKEDFRFDTLKELNPSKIFIPHWSYIIPKEIYENFECIVFHMTDLPYGRGGSPLQNLISLGHESTKISALRVEKGLDTGDIYLKKDLSLLGTAEEIFIRANKIIGEMILEIVKNSILPHKQSGEVTCFKRRTPEMSSIEGISEIDRLYDQIRMLDAEGYPKAFIETEYFKIEFSRASLKANKTIIADVRIFEK